MRSPIAYLAVAAAFVGGVFSQTINTPTNLVQCQPSLISWTGITDAVSLFITAGSDPSGTSILDLGVPSGDSFTYVVQQPAGTSMVFNIRLSSGAIVQTAIVTVNTGGNDDCLTASSSTSGATSATTGTTSVPTSTTETTSAGPTTTATGATTTSARPTTTTARTSTTSSGSDTGSAAGASTSSDNAAPTQFSVGVAGVVGAAMLAIMV